MTDLEQIEQIDIREFTNGAAMVLDAALAVIMLAFVVSRISQRGWYGELAVQAAVALSVVFAGKFLMRGWGVFLLFQMSHGGDGWAIEQQIPLSLIGMSIVAVGGLCAIRVFTPWWFGRWRDAVWLGAGLLSMAFGALIVWL